MLIAFIVATTLSVILTHRVRAFAVRMGIVDLPDNDRKMHEKPTPRAGGIGIFVTTAAVIGFAIWTGMVEWTPDEHHVPAFIALGVGGALAFGLGLVDDVLGGLRARIKFAVQALIALGVFLTGVRIEGLTLPGGGFLEFSILVSLALTVLWIVGVMNAFNLIDGSDGVAGGAAVFAAGAMAVVSILNGQELGALVAVTLAGATIGFLVFNFPPASIFLGDSGSLFLGFTLATLGVITTQTAQTALAVAIPVVSCGLPILDTLLAMARRLLRGESPFTPDRGHIHHRLRDLGHSPRKVALILYAASAGFALLSLVLVQPSGKAAATLLIVAGAAVGLAVQRLRIPELVEFGRVLGNSTRQRHVIAQNIRIRKAIERIRRASNASSLFSALRDGLEAGEFDRGEIWLPSEILSAFVGDDTGVVVDGNGCRWTWARTVESGNKFHLCEFRLPFVDDDGRNIGRLSLWYDLRRGGRPLTDLRLIAHELQPELWAAIKRLGAFAAIDIQFLEDGQESGRYDVVRVG